MFSLYIRLDWQTQKKMNYSIDEFIEKINSCHYCLLGPMYLANPFFIDL